MGNSRFSHGLRKHVFERGHARPQMTNLRTHAGGEREDLARAAFAWHEDAEEILAARVAVEARASESLRKGFGRDRARHLHSQFVSVTAWLLERRNGAL